MAVSAVIALLLENQLQSFNLLLKIGAGTGLVFIMRWFWWRINAYTEITGMVVSFLLAIYFELLHRQVFGFEAIPDHVTLVLSVGITTAAWLIVTLLTQPERQEVLASFYQKVKPAAWGWQKVIDKDKSLVASKSQLGFEIGMMFVACFMVYGALFATGYWIYGNLSAAIPSTIVALLGAAYLLKNWKKIKFL